MGTPINLPPYGYEFVQEGAVFATLKAEPQPTPNLTVFVSKGGLWLNGKTYMEFNGGNTGNFTPPATSAKWDLLVYNYSGFLQIIPGTPSSNPVLPDAPRNCFVICAVYLNFNTTAITSENLFDLRPIFCNPIYSHRDMSDNDFANLHPISSISGLQTALDERPNSVDIDTLLSAKADINGTPDVTFTLNMDLTGTPSGECKLEIERGDQPNVWFRWNESLNLWDFTDDTQITFKVQKGLFISDEQTGTGAEQSIAHDLEYIPSKVFVSVTSTTGAYTIIEGTHDDFDLKITLDSGVKYKVMAY